MYAQLGDIVFEGLFGFDGFSGKQAASLAEHARIDGKPRLQKVGDELEEIQLSIHMHSRFCNPEAQIAQLHSYVSDGAVLSLINGAGEFLGDFVIAEVGRSINHTTPTGQIISARVTVSLLEYAQSEDRVAIAARSIAFANAANGPVSVSLVAQLQGAGLSAMSSLVEARANANIGDIAVNRAKSVPTIEAAELAKADEAFRKTRESLELFEQKAQAVQNAINNYSTIQARLESAKTYVENAITAVEAADVNSAVSASQNLQGGLTSLTSATSSVVVQTAIRRV